MFEHPLRDQLASVGDRLGRLWLWKRLTWSWLGCTAIVIGLYFAGRQSVVALGFVATASALAATLLWVRSKSLPLARTTIARTIERAFPDLNSRLLAALEQSPEMPSGRMNVLQRQVISEAVHHSRINDWAEAIPARRLRGAFLRQAAALAGFLIVCGYVWPAAAQRTALIQNAKSIKIAEETDQPTIEPGDVSLERGSSLLVLARFPGQPPASVQLAWHGSSSEETLLPLTKSLDDPVFAGRLPTVNEDLEYRVDFDGRQSKTFKVSVYDLPALVRSDLKLQFPSYTGLETKTLEDAFVATVVEGSTVTITCRLNKPGVTATLVEKNGSAMTLHPDPANPLIVVGEFMPSRLHRLELKLVDQAGRQNRDPEEFRIEARPNLPPELAFVFPSQDVKVSPIEEMVIEATAWDDFGVLESGIVVTIPGRDPVTIPLGQNLNGGEKHKLSSLQRLEELKVDPNELISYYVYAEDSGPDGKPRRTSSDLYFA